MTYKISEGLDLCYSYIEAGEAAELKALWPTASLCYSSALDIALNSIRRDESYRFVLLKSARKYSKFLMTEGKEKQCFEVLRSILPFCDFESSEANLILVLSLYQSLCYKFSGRSEALLIQRKLEKLSLKIMMD